LPAENDLERLVHVFAKSVIPGSDQVRGHRITLLDDVDAYQIGKALGGMLVASVTGPPRNYVSGGERNSHQVAGGNIVAAVVRWTVNQPGERDRGRGTGQDLPVPQERGARLDGLDLAVEEGTVLGLLRPQRRGQDDHRPHPHHSSSPGRRPCNGRRLDVVRQSQQIRRVIGLSASTSAVTRT